MASPADQQRLYDMVRDVNRLRDSKWRGAGLALAPTFNAMQQEGPTAAAATAARFFPKPADRTMSAADRANLQAKVIKDMAEAQEKGSGARAGLAEKLMAKEKVMKSVFDFVLGAAGLEGDQAKAAADQFNSTMMGLTNQATQSMTKMLETTASPQAAPYVKQAIEAARAAMTASAQQGSGILSVITGGQMADPGLMADARQKLDDVMRHGTPADIALARAELDDIAKSYGLTSFTDYAAKIGQDQGNQDAAAIAAAMTGPEVEAQYQQALDGAASLAGANMMAGISRIKMPGMKAQKVFDLLSQFMADPKFEGILNGEVPPDQIGEIIEGILGKTDGGVDPAAKEAWQKLLDQLDQPELPPTSNLAEAKRRLFASDEFKGFMEQHGFQDPSTALTALRRGMRQEKGKAQEADRQLMRDRRRAQAGGAPVPQSNGSDQLVDESDRISFKPPESVVPEGMTAEPMAAVAPAPDTPAPEASPVQPKQAMGLDKPQTPQIPMSTQPQATSTPGDMTRDTIIKRLRQRKAPGITEPELKEQPL